MIRNNEVLISEYFKLKLLAEMLSIAIVQNPDEIAVMHGNNVKSYIQLYKGAKNISDQLLSAGIVPGERIALNFPRSIALYEIILACVISGISFMSLPRGFDETKQMKIAENANCSGIFFGNNTFKKNGIEINGIGNILKLPNSTKDFLINSKINNEIYCVRTSGSTGEPKIVPITSESLSAFLENCKKIIPIDKYKKWLWMHDLSFDYAIWETFGCLINCGCLVILDESMKQKPNDTFSLIKNSKVNILSVTPSEFRYIFFNDNLKTDSIDFNLSHIIMSGEKLLPSTIKPFFHNLDQQGVKFINLYGPSEATVFCAYHYINENDLSLESIPIGIPFPNIQFEIEPSNDTKSGVLKIYGPQVFKGYLGGQVLNGAYYTGDICRIDDNGRYIFLARSEGYQKVNGFRIKPYEIEEQLQSHPNVDEAVVRIKNTNDQGDYLEAYIRIKREAKLSTRDLRLLCSSLPPYLRPAKYILFDDLKWPINERGKTDRKLLMEMP